MSLEQGGKAINNFIEALRAQPLSLALVVMNCALLAYLFYTGRESLVQRNQYVKETQQILASCVHVDQLNTLLKAARDGK